MDHRPAISRTPIKHRTPLSPCSILGAHRTDRDAPSPNGVAVFICQTLHLPNDHSYARALESLQRARHEAQVAGRVPGHALRDRPDRCGHGQTPGRDRERLVRGQPLQHAPLAARRTGQGRGRRLGHGRDALQHHRGQRRDLHGHRGHELFASVARPHRGFHRDRDVGPVVRRQCLDPGLRQEHAGLPHGHGEVEPAGAHDLRRDHPAGTSRAGHPGCDLRVPELWPVPRG